MLNIKRKKMKKWTEKSIGIAAMLILSMLIVCYVMFKDDYTWKVDAPYLDEDYIFTKYELDTVEVIIEDGVRWYTIDTVWFEYVDPELW